MTASVLLLAGTTEAAELARALHGRAGVRVLASLAGRTSAPGALPCPVRVGGFDGVAGLVEELRAGGHRLLVDATHPFAAQMPRHAAAAATEAGVPRLRLVRPGWQPQAGDDWHRVPDLAAAARRLEALGARRALVTTGRLELAPFAGLAGTHLVVRSIEPLPPEALPGATSVLARGPFAVEDELELLAEHDIDVVVTKDSGGRATAPKLEAARRAGVPVVVVDRPPTPPGPVATTVADAVRWIEAHLG